MTTVFVHGNPETDAIWTDLVGELIDRGVEDLVLLSPPGFGSPVPGHWGATQIEYQNWLIAEVEAIGSRTPVDIVGHDWGAGHVFGLLAVHPQLVRSWACDCLGLMHPDYVWHDMAQLWQTPDVGEEVVSAMKSATTDERVSMMTGLGMNEFAATDVAASLDDIAECILPLYRSASQPAFADLGRRLCDIDLPPGLAIDPSEDPYVGPTGRVADMATRLGAHHSPLAGVGHWWMCQEPSTSAELLVDFWKSLKS